jgi:hypothetical protein
VASTNASFFARGIALMAASRLSAADFERAGSV